MYTVHYKTQPHKPTILNGLCRMFVFAIVLTNFVFAQQVQFVKRPGPNVPGALHCDLPLLEGPNYALGDIDGDGDLDMVMNGGRTPSLQSQFHGTYILENNGSGLFNPSYKNCLPDLTSGSVDLFDADSDGDLDLLITGSSPIISGATYFYLNNGHGIFHQNNSSSFVPLVGTRCDIGDVNGDGLPDIVMTGYESVSKTRLDIYLNDSNTVFTRVNQNFDGIYKGDVSLVDIDGDSDLDIFMSGSDPINNRVSMLYTNDGLANFSLKSTSVEPLSEASFEFGDVDNDSDMDLFIIGNAVIGKKSSLYINDGIGNLLLDSTLSLVGVNFGSVTMADYDGDMDLDIYYTGSLSSDEFGRILKNDGSGNFTQFDAGIMPIDNGKCLFTDINMDGSPDLISAGNNTSFGYGQTSDIYMNDGTGNLVGSRNHFVATRRGSMDVADIDNDGDIDFISTGSLGSQLPLKTQLFVNNGAGDFTDMNNAQSIKHLDGGVCFFDADGDGDKDLFISGNYNFNNNYAELYLNDGQGNYTLHSNIIPNGVFESSVTSGDIDGDSDVDLIVSGMGLSPIIVPVTQIYLNNGNAVFTLDSRSTISGVENGKMKLVDVDNDQDLDLFIMGSSHMEVYINDSTGKFTLSANNFPGIESKYGDFDVADIDADGDLDLLYLGDTAHNYEATLLYINDSTGIFTQDTANSFADYTAGSARFVDLDGDSDMDLFLIGRAFKYEMGFYFNNGFGLFTMDTTDAFEFLFSKVEFFDIDNDLDQDFVYHGYSVKQHNNAGYVYENISCQSSKITETVVSCGNFFWQKSACTYSSNGKYYYYQPNTQGCDSTFILDLTILPSPVVNWLNDSTLTTSNAQNATIQWYKCDSSLQPIVGAVSMNFVPKSNGHYAVVVDRGGCMDTSNCIEVNSIHLQELDHGGEISVFPQPALNILNINGLTSLAHFRIFNINGKLVQEGELKPHSYIRLSNLPEGIYLLSLESRGEIIYSKISVKGTQ